MSVAYWARCLQTGSLYSSEIRSLMFPDSANVWMLSLIHIYNIPVPAGEPDAGARIRPSLQRALP